MYRTVQSVNKATKIHDRGEVVTVADLAHMLDGREVSPGQYMAFCPCHRDNNASLAIKQGYNGNILLHCFAGCKYDEIVEALDYNGISLRYTLQYNGGFHLPKGIYSEFEGKKYVAHYEYRDEDGEVIGYTVRFESGAGEKVIIPYFNKVDGQWKAGYSKSVGNYRPLYNLDKIAKASPETEIWIVEGEKCADALTNLGFIATTSPGGASGANKADWEPLASSKMIIWPDKDSAGRTYAVNVFKQLIETGDSDPDIRIVAVDELEDLKAKDDVWDWIEKGHDKKDVLSLPLNPVNGFEDLDVVIVDESQIHEVIDQAESQLMKTNPYAIFQQGNRLVRIHRLLHKAMIANEDHTIGLSDVTPHYLLDLLNKKVTFVRSVKQDFLPIDPPNKIATRYLARSGQWHVNILSGLIYAPTLRPDGSALEFTGYDMESGLFYAKTETKFSQVPKDPSKEDATGQLQRLRYLFKDFPFVEEADESVVIAAILTSLIRKSLRTAPLFGFTAPTAGSGKTLLANVISIIATGRQAIVTPYGKDKEEERKSLFSKLLQGKPVLLIDNIEQPISSDTLCAILTAPGQTYSDRILGKSEIIEVPTNITMLATGNNLAFQGDMTRRALLCTIDPKMEKPETREGFKIKDLEQYTLDHRNRYVTAGLTVLKAYINAGKPKQNIPQYGSFEDWSDWVRSAIVWLGMSDPYLTKVKIEKDDPFRFNLSRILAIWHRIYEDEPIPVSEIVADCNSAIDDNRTKSDEYELAQAFIEVTGTRGKQLNPTQVGNWLKQNKDRVIEGYSLIIDPNSEKLHSRRWIVKK